MRLSVHSMVRSQQRGIPLDMIEIILRFGTPEKRPGNVLGYRLRKRDKARIVSSLKRQIQRIEKAAAKAVLVAEDGTVITAYNVTK